MKIILNPIIVKNEKIINKINNIKKLSMKHYRDGLDFKDGAIRSGAYGVYYRKGKIGVKVLRTNFYHLCSYGGYKHVRSLVKSRSWKSAIKEFRLLKKAERSGLTPIPYCVKPVCVGNKYYPAIFMEHIVGTPLDEAPLGKFAWNQINTLIRTSERTLKRKCGIDHHEDCGGSNVIIVKHKKRKVLSVKIIDFTPDFTHLIRRRKNGLEKNR